ncbi:hypothetical protein DFH06DRAFT_1144068 [Mycena polygramma]|nr:hypothetical protein DFH06DRAFT_1144068 [Mycena polygramma]
MHACCPECAANAKMKVQDNSLGTLRMRRRTAPFASVSRLRAGGYGGGEVVEAAQQGRPGGKSTPRRARRRAFWGLRSRGCHRRVQGRGGGVGVWRAPHARDRVCLEVGVGMEVAPPREPKGGGLLSAASTGAAREGERESSSSSSSKETRSPSPRESERSRSKAVRVALRSMGREREEPARAQGGMPSKSREMEMELERGEGEWDGKCAHGLLLPAIDERECDCDGGPGPSSASDLREGSRERGSWSSSAAPHAPVIDEPQGHPAHMHTRDVRRLVMRGSPYATSAEENVVKCIKCYT